MARTLQTVWCDDIRMEIGNKMSLMGIYSNEMLVPAFPFIIEKLCLSCKAITDIKKPFKLGRIVVSKNNDLLAEVDMAESLPLQEGVIEKPKDGAKFITAQSLIVLRQIVVDKPTTFRVKLVTETGETKGQSLRVDLGQQKPI